MALGYYIVLLFAGGAAGIALSTMVIRTRSKTRAKLKRHRRRTSEAKLA